MAQSAWPPPCLFFFLGSHREDVRFGGGVFVWTYCSTSLYSANRAFKDKDRIQPLVGGNARDFFWTYCSTSMYSAKQEHPKTRTQYSLGGNARDFFSGLFQQLTQIEPLGVQDPVCF